MNGDISELQLLISECRIAATADTVASDTVPAETVSLDTVAPDTSSADIATAVATATADDM